MALDTRATINLVVDRRLPDGTEATEELVMAALQLCEEQDPGLYGLLIAAVFGLGHDETELTWEERKAALDELEGIAARPPEHPVSDGYIAMAADLAGRADTGTRSARRTLHERGLGHGRALRARPRPKRHTTAEARAVLEDEARDAGWDAGELLQPIPHGRLSAADQRRRDALAIVAARSHGRGLRQVEIGAALGISRQRVSELVRRGETLLAA